MGILKQGKDRVLSLFLRQRLNDLLGGAGSAEAFSVNTADHTIAIRLQLAGEREPLDLLIKEYRIQRLGERHVLTFEEIGTSREWVNVLLKRFLTVKRFDIPDEYGDLAENLLG
jgi:hypothetical protein